MLNKLIDRVEYTCKECGWKASIMHIWEDIKPRRCPNKKCATNFLAHKDKLDIKKPQEPSIILHEKTDKLAVKKKYRKRK